MNLFPQTNYSMNRAGAISRVFSTLRNRAGLPAFSWALALMLGGACADVHAQAAHFTRAHRAAVIGANSNQGSPQAVAAGGPGLNITPSSGNFGPVNVGSTSATPISLIFTFATAGTLGSTTVVTQGATNLDFTDAGTGTCKAGTAYGTGATCTVNVNFSPRFAGTRYGAADLLDGAGSVLATGYLQGTGVGPQLTFLPGTQSVVANAGNGLAYPQGVAVDGGGNVYIVDFDLVLKQTPSTGGYTQSVVPTSGLSSTTAVAVDGSGNVYIADYVSSQVVKETLSAGGYTQRVVANAANNGLNRPTAVAVDGNGNVYISDTGRTRVLKETLSSGNYIAQSIVADGVSNGLNNAIGVAVDGSGNVYIADWLNLRVLKETLSAGGYTQSVVVDSSTDGLYGPTGIAVDGTGSVFIVYSNVFLVLKATPSAAGYTQSVIANAANNGLYFPHAVAVDGSGNVYIGDNSFTNSRVVKEDLADPPTVTFPSVTAGATSLQTVTVSNNGNAALIFPVPGSGDNPSVSAYFVWDPTSTCQQSTANSSAAFELAGETSCTLSLDFEPTTLGSYSGTVKLTDNNLNVTGTEQGIQLAGICVGTQTITFPQPTSPVIFGVAPITLRATGGASGNPVLYSIVSGPGSLSGTNHRVLQFTGWGTVVVAANQAGNAFYNAAPQVTRSVVVEFSRLAALTSPTPGSILTGSSATFTWSQGTGATEYMLYLGTTGVRSDNLYNSGPTSATSVNVTGLPINGETIYARLYSYIGGAWHTLDYTYTAEPLEVTLTSPTPNSTLNGSNATFTWSTLPDVTKYELLLGTNGSGSDNLFHSGITTATAAIVTGLPVNGERISARLYWYVDGGWKYLDYIYKAYTAQ